MDIDIDNGPSRLNRFGGDFSRSLHRSSYVSKVITPLLIPRWPIDRDDEFGLFLDQ